MHKSEEGGSKKETRDQKRNTRGPRLVTQRAMTEAGSQLTKGRRQKWHPCCPRTARHGAPGSAGGGAAARAPTPPPPQGHPPAAAPRTAPRRPSSRIPGAARATRNQLETKLHPLELRHVCWNRHYWCPQRGVKATQGGTACTGFGGIETPRRRAAAPSNKATLTRVDNQVEGAVTHLDGGGAARARARLLQGLPPGAPPRVTAGHFFNVIYCSYKRSSTCNVQAVVKALGTGEASTTTQRGLLERFLSFVCRPTWPFSLVHAQS